MCIATAIASDDGVNLNELLDKHGIDRSFRQAFELIIESGETINDDFRRRLNELPNFQECADEALLAFPAKETDGQGFHGPGNPAR